MSVYPVHYSVERPERCSRLQLGLRLIAFLALGAVGLSFGLVFVFAYLALPVFAASRLAATDREHYANEDAPRLLRALHWFAAISGWAGLVVEQLPGRRPDESLQLTIDGSGHADGSAVAWRVVKGLPSAFVLVLLLFLGWFVWMWAALSILLTERIGPGAFRYLVGLQRWSVRLLAYQGGLIDDYPPFSFSDQPPILPPARVAGQ